MVDDVKKRVALSGFRYDPMARTYELQITSLLDHPVDDRLTVEVLGPNGVVIWEQETPILLDPAAPLRHSITVPSDLRSAQRPWQMCHHSAFSARGASRTAIVVA